MAEQNQNTTPSQTLLEQITEELSRHNRGLVTELPRWMQ